MTDFESFNALEIEAGELLNKIVQKRDADPTVNNTERRVLFMLADQVNNVRMWLSAISSDEFTKNGGKND